MSSRTRGLMRGIALLSLCLPLQVFANGGLYPTPSVVEWSTSPTDASMVRFHIQWANTSSTDVTAPITGDLSSQYYGAFVPDFGSIGSFNIPSLAPNGFFDIFLDMPRSALPQTYEFIDHAAPVLNGLVDCLPGDHWDGNVDLRWRDQFGNPVGQANYHIGDIKVVPGNGASYIHIISGCNFPIAWGLAFNCPGWNVTLVNENLLPAPNPLPPLWTGFVRMTAGPNVAIGDSCCVTLTMNCNGVVATVVLCGVACDWATPAERTTWGRIKSIYR